MKKSRMFLIFIPMLLFILFISGYIQGNSGNAYLTKSNKRYKEQFTIKNLHNGDAKFYGNHVITNKDGLLIYDLKGHEIKKYSDINANWIEGIEEEGIIVYGNFNNETGMIRLDKKLNIIDTYIIMKTDLLAIDQTITKIKKKYYMTMTTIKGNVNNSDPEKENGVYTVKLYKSKNLSHWEYVSDIISCNQNIEDVDILQVGDRLAMCYEKEIIDKGKSAVHMIFSNDQGKHWENDRILLEADSDHEPATIVKKSGKFELYYSSDKENLGASYNGAKIYKAVYDSDFKLIKKDIPLKLKNQVGNLLYDTMYNGNRFYLCFAKNYLTEGSLVVESE